MTIQWIACHERKLMDDSERKLMDDSERKLAACHHLKTIVLTGAFSRPCIRDITTFKRR
jgi:hypothetical protein